MDQFHAVQRTTQHLKKGTSKPGNNPKSSEKLPKATRIAFLRELSSCFRKEGDNSKLRRENTPQEKELRENLKKLISKWEDSRISPGALGSLKYLADHHSRCLSDIPPGGGTTR